MCQAQVQFKLESDLVSLRFLKFSIDEQFELGLEINFHGLIISGPLACQCPPTCTCVMTNVGVSWCKDC